MEDIKIRDDLLIQDNVEFEQEIEKDYVNESYLI